MITISHFAWPYSKQDYRHSRRLIMLMISIQGAAVTEGSILLYSEWWRRRIQRTQEVI